MKSKRGNRSGRAEDTRERIVHFAMELFAEKGYHRTSIDDIARKCRVTKGALYWHFFSKKDLLSAVVQKVRTSWLTEVYLGVKNEPHSLRKLSLILRNHARLIEDNPTLCSLLVVLVTEASRSDREIQKLLKELYSDWQSLLAAVVAQGKKEGEVRADVDEGQVASNVVNVMHGAILTAMVASPSSNAFRMMRNFETVLRQGIGS